MPHYIALIHKDPDSDYGVSFPDFPGCVTAGRSLEEARTLAEKALSFHARGMAEDGEPLPAPSTLNTISALPEFAGAVIALVPLAA